METGYASVPHGLRGKEVDVRATEQTVEIYYQRQRQASHARVQSPGRYSTHDLMIPQPASSPRCLIAIAGLGDRQGPEFAIVFSGIRN